MAMVLLRPLLGETPTSERPLRCWYWSGEDEREEVERRIAAICQHHRIDARTLEGLLFYDSFQEIPITIATQGRNGIAFDETQIKQITDAIRRKNIDVAVFDPLISAHKVPEGDNVAMDAVVKTFAKIAADTNCAIDLDHHTRKLAPGQSEVTIEDARGASAIIGAARSSRLINRMTGAEAANVGLSEVERQSYFRIGRAKANRAPPEASTWARMVSVAVPNGDNVGALEAWEYPDAFANGDHRGHVCDPRLGNQRGFPRRQPSKKLDRQSNRRTPKPQSGKQGRPSSNQAHTQNLDRQRRARHRRARGRSAQKARLHHPRPIEGRQRSHS